MKALVISRRGKPVAPNITHTEVPEPAALETGEVRLRTLCSALNHLDLWVGRGVPGLELEYPRVGGCDICGVVEAVGEGVEEFAVGDNVVSTFFPPWLDGEPQEGNFTNVPGDGLGGYAREQVVRAATAFTRAPEGYSHAEAATLTTAGLTAWRALTVDNHIKAGDTILVLGTGGVSIFALQFARLVG